MLSLNNNTIQSTNKVATQLNILLMHMKTNGKLHEKKERIPYLIGSKRKNKTKGKSASNINELKMVKHILSLLSQKPCRHHEQPRQSTLYFPWQHSYQYQGSHQHRDL